MKGSPFDDWTAYPFCAMHGECWTEQECDAKEFRSQLERRARTPWRKQVPFPVAVWRVWACLGKPTSLPASW